MTHILDCVQQRDKIVAVRVRATAMAQRRCNAAPVTEQEFPIIGKIVV